MFMGGISGSGPATAAAVGGVMIAAMHRAGYPCRLLRQRGGWRSGDRYFDSALGGFYRVFGAGARRFGARTVCGRPVSWVLAGLALIIPAVWLARRHGMGQLEASLPRPPFWKSLREAAWDWPRRC